MVDMDSIYCIEEPVTFTDSSTGGKYVYGVNTGAGFSYECDTVDAIAWVLSQTLDLPYYLVHWEQYHWITLILLLMELQSLW